jgi:hypothetical protein
LEAVSGCASCGFVSDGGAGEDAGVGSCAATSVAEKLSIIASNPSLRIEFMGQTPEEVKKTNFTVKGTSSLSRSIRERD